MSLPEMNVNDGIIVSEAKSGIALRGQIAQLDTVLKSHTSNIAKEATKLRDGKIAEGFYIGLIRVTGEDMPASRVEFKTNSSSGLSIEQGPELDEMLGPARPLIFQKTMIVTEITDPQKLIDDLVAAGKNPWDHLTLSVRGEQDTVVAGVSPESVIAQEAFKPTKGWLESLGNIAATLTETALNFMNEYIKVATTATVVLGSRGKSSSK